MTDNLVLAIAGAGSDSVPAIFTQTRQSMRLLELFKAKSKEDLESYIGTKLEKIGCEETALRMAVAAYQRGIKRLGNEPNQGSIGLACVTPLQMSEKVAANSRAFVAIHTSNRTLTASIGLDDLPVDPRHRDRAIVELVLQAMSQFGLSPPQKPQSGWATIGNDVRFKIDPNCIDIRHSQAADPFCDLVEGRVVAVNRRDEDVAERPFHFDMADWLAVQRTPVLRGQVIFPGSFNPPHAGNQQMAAIASREIGRKVVCELAVINADKPPLDYLSMRKRIELLAAMRLPFIITRAAKFFEKADLFPESVFVVGADTAIRIADPKFYGNQSDKRDEALDYFSARGCRFLVFGRSTANGFQSAERLDLPPAMRKISQPVPEHKFRNDISSTQLRRQGANE